MNNINRIKVNLSSREFEVEGTEDFVRFYDPQIQAFLSQFAAQGASDDVPETKVKGHSERVKTRVSKKRPPIATKVKGPGSTESIKINPNLNLRGDGSSKSFKDFATEKQPKAGPEFNAVAVHYLHEIMSLSPITLNDAFTCYKEVGQRPPEKFRQAFIDTKNKKGWVHIDENGHLSMTARGNILVEHDLPRANTKAAAAGTRH